MHITVEHEAFVANLWRVLQAKEVELPVVDHEVLIGLHDAAGEELEPVEWEACLQSVELALDRLMEAGSQAAVILSLGWTVLTCGYDSVLVGLAEGWEGGRISYDELDKSLELAKWMGGSPARLSHSDWGAYLRVALAGAQSAHPVHQALNS